MESPARTVAAGVAIILAVTLMQPALSHGGSRPTETPVPSATPTPTEAAEKKTKKSGPVLAEFRYRTDRLTAGELSQLLALSGFTGSGHRTAWLVAMRESRGNPRAHNDNASTGDDSYGLFQINMRGYLGTARRDKYVLDWNGDLWDPVTNAWVAYQMSNRGRDFGAWGLGPNAYRQHGYGSLQRFVDQYPGHPSTWRRK